MDFTRNRVFFWLGDETTFSNSPPLPISVVHCRYSVSFRGHVDNATSHTMNARTVQNNCFVGLEKRRHHVVEQNAGHSLEGAGFGAEGTSFQLLQLELEPQ